MTQIAMQSPKDKFRRMPGEKYPTVRFTSKVEFSNMQAWLARRGAAFEVSRKKRSSRAPETWVITLVSPIEELGQ